MKDDEMPESGSCGDAALGPVLCLDPDPTDRARTARALEADGSALTVEEVPTAAALRDALADETTEYACVVTEYRLEETDALSLYDSLRAAGLATVPIVLYTADGDETVASDAITTGLSGYVPKGRTDSSDLLAEQLRAILRADDEALPTTQTDDFGLGLEETRDAVHALESCSSIEETYRLAIDAVDRLLETDATAMFVERDDPDTSRISADFAPVAVTGGDEATAAFREPTCEGLVEQALRTDTTGVIDPTTYAGSGEPTAADVRSVVSVPVNADSVLQTISTTPNAFDGRAVSIVKLVAATVASTVSRIRSERERRNERERFAALFESVPDAVLVLDRTDGVRVVAVNPSFEELFGYDREALTEYGIDELLVPEGSEEIDVYESVGLESVVTAEVERCTTDGPRDFLFRGFATEIDGEIHEYAIYTDTSEQKRRERKLERYRTLVETVSDSMYVLDSTGRVEIVNEAMADYFGEPRDAIVGEHATEFITEAELEERWTLIEEIQASDDRRSATIETTVESPTGSTHHIEDNIAPVLDDDGQLLGSVGAIRDITARKEHERRIRRLHDGTRRLMAATESDEIARIMTDIASEALDLDLNSVFLYEPEITTRSAAEATGDTRSAAEVTDDRSDGGSTPDTETAPLDKANDGLVPAAMSDRAVELFGNIGYIESGGGIAWDAYEAGEAIVHGDVRRASNVRNPETPVRSEAHVPLGEHGIFIVSSLAVNGLDPEALTLARILAANAEAALDRAARECELADRSRELERQNDRLEAFASTVSHDLRNPLTVATGQLENVAEHVDEGGNRHVEEIAWALDRMDELVENVLALARSGQRLTETATVDLDVVLDQAHRAVDPTLEVDREGSLPTVDGDESRLRALFENVLRNAREHVGDDVTVTVTATGDGFAIEDDGPGISAGERDAALEWGYSTAAEGTGFGLAIVSEVVEAHGWSIALEESASGGLRIAVSVETP
ncbi:hybrid sensor histidine kinase/response regulator [Natronorubrum texcoconense]|uniref:histidine kinase n=1 Tax=Natronorubrum texcoconense TaxID=1095776 RepID=A0A1G8SX72_9EURY|nr:PAS domain S-box protein [Natronorubrum texcoconense]SDJ33774.1 PAS domain S-box-containing protein [Natronorubrum texcoconense]